MDINKKDKNVKKMSSLKIWLFKFFKNQTSLNFLKTKQVSPPCLTVPRRSFLQLLFTVRMLSTGKLLQLWETIFQKVKCNCQAYNRISSKGDELYYGLVAPYSLFSLRWLVHKYLAITDCGIAQIGCGVTQSLARRGKAIPSSVLGSSFEWRLSHRL